MIRNRPAPSERRKATSRRRTTGKKAEPRRAMSVPQPCGRIRLGREWHPKIDALPRGLAGKPALRDSDNNECRAFQAKGAADSRRIAAEPSRPERVADHRNGETRRLQIVGGEHGTTHGT